MVHSKNDVRDINALCDFMHSFLARYDCFRKSVIEQERAWTYAEFVAQSINVARYLRDKGITRLLIHLPQGFTSYTLIWGAYLAGTTFCNAGHGIPTERIEYYLAVFKPELVVSDVDLGGAQVVTEDITRYPGNDSPHFTLDAIIDPLSTAYVLFTSGSTGMPKGVMISRRSLESVVQFAIAEYEVNHRDIWAQYSSLGFDLSILDIFVAIASGAALVPIAAKGDKLLPARLIERHGITIWHSVPSAFELIDRLGKLTSRSLASLRLLIFCGEKLFPTLVDKIFAARPDLTIYNTYGPTEATIFCTYQKLSKNTFSEVSRATVSIGNCVPGTTIELDGTAENWGELIIRGLNVGKGYLGDEQPSGYLTEADGALPTAYRTGDFCRFEGNILYFECRKDRQVKIAGNRVDLSEIDLQLRELGCESAVSLLSDHCIKSFVLGGPWTHTDLHDLLKKRLPVYYIPTMIYKLDTFPYTESGKIDTQALLNIVESSQ